MSSIIVITMIEAFPARFSIARGIAFVPKRIRFVVSSFAMGLLLLASTLFGFEKALFLLPILLIVTYITVYFSVLEGIEKVEWYMLFITPLLLTAVAYLYYFLLPTRWLTRVPYVLVYIICMYATLLTSNVLNVGVEKGLQLYRAAFSVNFFFQTFCIFLMTQVFASFRSWQILQASGVAIVAILTSFQLLWSTRPRIIFDAKTIPFVLFIGLLMFEVVLTLCFINVPINIVAIFCTGFYYSISSIIYHHIDGRLFASTVREYLFALIAVAIIFLLVVNY